jgi:hypothetical protein
MYCSVLILNRAQWIPVPVYCGDVRNEARQYEDMNDGPALLNEFLTPTNVSGSNNKLQNN